MKKILAGAVFSLAIIVPGLPAQADLTGDLESRTRADGVGFLVRERVVGQGSVKVVRPELDRGETRMVVSCGENNPNRRSADSVVVCDFAATICSDFPGGEDMVGMREWRREAGSSEWANDSENPVIYCREPQEVNVVTLGMIRSAFKAIKFANPALRSGPFPSNETLVNLDTWVDIFFVDGVPPLGERKIRVLGRGIEVRPVLREYRVAWGDGEVYRFDPGLVSGEPRDLASQADRRSEEDEPDDRLIHDYRETGQVTVVLRVVYDAQYRFNSGQPWQDLSLGVVRAADPLILDVYQVRNRLYNPDLPMPPHPESLCAPGDLRCELD
ncbi:MAG: hypothetical protein ACRCTR_05625 [Actinomycetota bacterium]